MIRYALKCQEGHEFESWFQSASAQRAKLRARTALCASMERNRQLINHLAETPP